MNTLLELHRLRYIRGHYSPLPIETWLKHVVCLFHLQRNNEWLSALSSVDHNSNLNSIVSVLTVYVRRSPSYCINYVGWSISIVAGVIKFVYHVSIFEVWFTICLHLRNYAHTSCLAVFLWFRNRYIDGLAQDCSNCIANALESLQSYAKLSRINLIPQGYCSGAGTICFPQGRWSHAGEYILMYHINPSRRTMYPIQSSNIVCKFYGIYLFIHCQLINISISSVFIYWTIKWLPAYQSHWLKLWMVIVWRQSIIFTVRFLWKMR